MLAIGKDASKAFQAISKFCKSLFLNDGFARIKAKQSVTVKKMLYEQPAQNKERLESFFWPNAENVKEVCLSGDFNHWKPEQMIRDENGFCATVKLAPGTYQYKFVVDGEWKTDPASKQSSKNDFGTTNSVLTVE